MNNEGPREEKTPEAADRATQCVCKGVGEVGLKFQEQYWTLQNAFEYERSPARYKRELGSLSASSYISAVFVVACRNCFLQL